jgi:hypothetical protein
LITLAGLALSAGCSAMVGPNLQTTDAGFETTDAGSEATDAGAQLPGKVNLAWDANTEPYLGGYTLSYGTESHAYSQSIDVGNVTTYTVDNLQSGTTYYFAVSAYDTPKTSSSDYSNEVSQTVP